MVFVHGDFLREVHIPVQEGSDDIELSFFVRVIGSVKLHFKQDVLLSIEEILFASERKTFTAFLGFREHNCSDALLEFGRNQMLKDVDIAFASKL